MKVKIKKTHPGAVIPFKKHESDFCYDLTCVSVEELGNDMYKYSFGLAFQIEREEYSRIMTTTTKPSFSDDLSTKWNPRAKFINLSIDGRPRSSVYKQGMMLVNCTSTVDENFTNEVSAIFWHYNKSLPRYQVGDRILQIKIGITFPIDFVEVDELIATDRGNGGFGSTGR